MNTGIFSNIFRIRLSLSTHFLQINVTKILEENVTHHWVFILFMTRWDGLPIRDVLKKCPLYADCLQANQIYQAKETYKENLKVINQNKRKSLKTEKYMR